jgi:hypothetical protein
MFNNYFSVGTDDKSQLGKAIASYLFDFISLNDKIAYTNKNINYLEGKVTEAFCEVLQKQKVKITTKDGNNIVIELESVNE